MTNGIIQRQGLWYETKKPSKAQQVEGKPIWNGTESVVSGKAEEEVDAEFGRRGATALDPSSEPTAVCPLGLY